MTAYTTCVYIDGFNFYHSIEQHIKDKEVVLYPSLRKLCSQKLESFADETHNLVEINYFTAYIEPTYKDPGKRYRQKNYNHALKCGPEYIKIHYGKFVRSGDDGKRKEKQSDVNLATRFVYDACMNEYDYAVILSNDTDFCGAIKFVLEQFPEKSVDVWSVDKVAEDLSKEATLCHSITVQDFAEVPQIANFSFDPKGVDMP